MSDAVGPAPGGPVANGPAPGGPVIDLRLVPAAAACWLACGIAVGSGASTTAAAAWVVAAGLVLACAWRERGRARGLGRRRALRRPVRGARLPVVACQVRTTRAAGWWTAVLAGVTTAAALLSCSAQLNAREAGLLPHLLEERAVVEVVGVVREEVSAAPAPWYRAAADAVDGSDAGLAGQSEHAGGARARAPDERFRTVLAIESVAGRGRHGSVAARLLVLGGSPWSTIAYGTRVRVTGRLAPVEAGEPVVGQLTAWGPVTTVTPPNVVDQRVATLRTSLLAVTDHLPADARGLVPGAAIGDTSRVPDDLDAAMRAVGLTHVTAVSGSHFAVLSMAVLALTALLRMPRAARAAVSVAVTGWFVLLVHPEPSVVRAAVMGCVAAAGLLAGRRSRALPALAMTVVVLLVLDPWLARSFGFALSVLATAAIVLLAPPLAARLGRALPRAVALAIAVPAAAQAVCAPVVVLLDPVVSVYAVPANLLAAPALVPATLLGVAATVVAPVAPPVAGVLAQGAGLATWWIAAVARAGAAAPGARQPWPAGVGGAVLLAGITVVLVCAAMLLPRLAQRVRRGALVVVLVGGLAVALLLTPPLRSRAERLLPGGPPDDWRVVMCDVGQGDALVVRSGPREAVVIDVGPDGSAAGDCLDDLGVTTIELLVLTHHHADHVGGLAAVLAGRDVVQAVVSPLPQPRGQASRSLESLAAAGVPVMVGVAGTGAQVGLPGTVSAGLAGEVRWSVLWPRDQAMSAADVAASLRAPAEVDSDGQGDESEGSAINDSSIVLLLETPDLTVLALGDVEPDAQDSLAPLLPAAALRPDVLKVAHHGSAHQSARLAALLTPAVALVSVGADNTYGHPAPSTLRLLEQRGAVVMTTKECGDVVVSPDDLDDGRLEVHAACVR